MLGMMVAVDAVEHLDRHTEEVGGLPLVDTKPASATLPPCDAECGA
jgi:hypothetical protein